MEGGGTARCCDCTGASARRAMRRTHRSVQGKVCVTLAAHEGENMAALIGLLVGALVGRWWFEEWGTIVGGLVGFIVGALVSSQRERAAFRKPDTTPASVDPATRRIEARLAALEQRLGAIEAAL